MKRKYEFDWSRFTEQDLLNLNNEKDLPEDDIYGFILLNLDGERPVLRYIIDIHYEYYSSKERGFDLEVYRSNEYEQHLAWIGSCRGIKSATKYNRFRTRAEDLIINMFNDMDATEKNLNISTSKEINTHALGAEILEIFDDFLIDKEISIPCKDVNEQNERGEDNEAALYGTEYSDLLQDIEGHLIHVLRKNGVKVHPYSF